MTTVQSWMTRALVALLLPAPLLGQGVPLPPIGSAPTVQAAPAAVQADEKAKEKDEEVLPPPKLDKSPPLGQPPQLGGAIEPGTLIGKPASKQAISLALKQVISSVDMHYPLVQAAEQERLIAQGRELSALGAFDVNLRSQEYGQDGSYDSQRYGVGFSQQTAMQGLSYFANYRLGSGDYPVYYGDRKTAEGGEFRAGVVLPLLRNRAIDSARASLAKAGLDREMAEPNINLQRIDITKAASRAYWWWVAAGQRYLVAAEVLSLAERRDDLLKRRVKAGNLAEIERQDNLRAVVERQARLVAARRAVEATAINLSLYFRDEEGKPAVPMGESLPALVTPEAPPGPAQRHFDFEEAVKRRPELQQLELTRRKILVDLELSENLLLPGVNVGVTGSQDVGFGKRSPSSTSRLDRQSVEVALLVDVPLQRRDARGRMVALRAELVRIAERERFAMDRIQLDLQDALNAIDRAYDLLRRGRDNRLQADYLERAERQLFNVGKSDLFRVNIRELVTAEARLLEIDAAAEYYRALADYHAALGLF